jgi:predicted metal-binding membrane protein
MTARTTATFAATLGLGAACWVVAVRQMDGMDMGGATDLGSFASFAAVWVPMMAAMMLPAAVPAVSAFARRHRSGVAAPLFAGSYLVVWALVGLAVYALYRPHGSTVAGALTIAAGLYELAPLKRECRRRCRESVRSGFQFGRYCVGSSAGLMLILISLGIMSITWMVVVAALVAGQKLLPPRPLVDVPVALSIVGLGVLVAVAPSSVPGLVVGM